MPKPIAPLVCDSATARAIGAVHYADPPAYAHPLDRVRAIIEATERVGVLGHIAVMTHGTGGVWAWPIQPGARNTGAGL